MKKLKLSLALLLCAVAVVLCVLAIRGSRGRPASTVAQGEINVKQDKLRREFLEISGLVAATEARTADLNKSLDELQKQTQAAAAKMEIIHMSQLTEFDPKFREAVEKGMKARYMGVWEPLFRSLHLSEKDRDDFWAIYKDFAERRDDVTQATVKFKMDSDSPGIESLMKQEIEVMRQAMAGRFGEAREKEFFEFLRQMEPRSFADGLATRVAFTEPLTSGQVDRITQVVAEATPRYAKGNFADNRNIDWTKVDEEVRGILSEKQFEAWKQKGLSGRNKGFSREQTEMNAAYEKVLKAERAAAKS
ncbi:MAG: hypothetical protein QM760_22495 [Nibricoccus sp.]